MHVRDVLGRPGSPMRLVLRELLIVASFVVVYFAVRGRTEGNVARADHNAREVLRAERWLHIDVERQVQDTVHDSHLLTTLVNWVYIWGHWPVIVATLLWLVLRHPTRYLLIRNAILISGAVGMVTFALYPVTPPRLLRIGLVDTVTEYSTSYRVLQPAGFVNQYAAMPSLHMGWDLLMGIAIVVCARRWWVKGLGALLPLFMAWAVVATANHYVLDALVGTALVLLALLAATQLPRVGSAVRRHRWPPGWAPGTPPARLPVQRGQEQPADQPQHGAGGDAGEGAEAHDGTRRPVGVRRAGPPEDDDHGGRPGDG
jgi:membrane-associated phospholipid phosphatase